MMVGFLNRQLGFKEFKPIKVGTPIYEQHGIYYLWQEANSGLYCEMVRYYKDNLKPAINFTPLPTATDGNNSLNS